MGIAPAVFILPEDIELTAGPASNHRQFLDMHISQFSPGYLRDLISYRKVVMQRNKLLKDVAGSPDKIDLLKPWDELIIRHGFRIIEERKKFTDSIARIAEKYFRKFNGDQKVFISYIPRINRDIPNIKEAISVQLAAYREREIRAGLTLVGPHRDRLVMNINGKSVRHYGSRGQKRCMMLALKLAVADFLTAKSGKDVILILDEVFAELDRLRSQALMEMLLGYKQVFIATAGEFGFQDIKHKKFHIEDGVIEELSV